MATQPGYPAARTAAARVHPHYARHLAATQPALLPDIETIEAIVDAAFWASLRREEDNTPLVSLAFVAPAMVTTAMTLERPVPLESQRLTRLGPAVERPGIHLGVHREDGQLCVWGATRNLPAFCFVLEVIGPGLLVIKHSRGDDSGKFVNVAVLQGDEVKIIDRQAAVVMHPQFDSPDLVKVLIQLAVSMRAHRRGGSLLVVPAQSDRWLESILQPITYAVAPPFPALMELMREDTVERTGRRWKDMLRRVIDGVAGLTAVDGATIITDRFELLAFGAKIVRPPGRAQVGQVIATEPIEGIDAVVAEPSLLGGTRHLSAAQFTHDQRDTIALVASQDGRFTVFGWSPLEEMVHAHRIETLLL
jgi:hypothetical protein